MSAATRRAIADELAALAATEPPVSREPLDVTLTNALIELGNSDQQVGIVVVNPHLAGRLLAAALASPDTEPDR